jgi:hypothetical protein
LVAVRPLSSLWLLQASCPDRSRWNTGGSAELVHVGPDMFEPALDLARTLALLTVLYAMVLENSYLMLDS